MTNRPAIVTGGRKFNGTPAAEKWLLLQLHRHAADIVYHGDCGERDDAGRVVHGADLWAAEVAARVLGLPSRPFPADWSRHGDRAGPLRNWSMAFVASQPGLVPVCLAFPGGAGTGSMINYAARRGIEVIKYSPAGRGGR